jgi:hypothetical protein
MSGNLLTSWLGREEGRRDYERGSQAVESKEECHQPEDRVGDFDGEFGCREEEGEQADVSGHCQRAESS